MWISIGTAASFNSRIPGGHGFLFPQAEQGVFPGYAE